MRKVTVAEVDDAGLERFRHPRGDVVVEGHPIEGVYRLERGPFRHYVRSLDVETTAPGHHRVTQTVDFQLGLGPWSALFAGPMLKVLGRPGGRPPWWAPPQVLDRQGAAALASLAYLSLVGGYLGTLLTQTITFASDEFGVDERVQGDTLAAVRVGVVVSMFIAAWADRHGRRRALLWCAAGGCVATAAGAVAPGMVALGGTQVVARGLSTALALLIVVVVAEEMPAGARAYGVSLLTLTGGLGAGVALWLLPLVEIDDRAWRLLFVVPLLFLPVVRATARMLPESRRFVRRHATARFAGHGRRLALLAGSAFALAAFGTPASQLQNEFLRDEYSFTAAHITLFVVLTVTPGSLGVVVGGRLADVHGKRLVGALGVAGGTAFTVLQFVGGSVTVVWIASALGSVVGGLAVPALAVYGPELFPTALRSRANVAITVLGVCGSVTGLLIAGRLAERWSLGPGIAALAVAPAVVVLLLIPRYPETSHRELEELNPEDAAGLPSDGRGFQPVGPGRSTRATSFFGARTQ
jgi:MFS family permease